MTYVWGTLKKTETTSKGHYWTVEPNDTKLYGERILFSSGVFHASGRKEEDYQDGDRVLVEIICHAFRILADNKSKEEK